MCPDAYEALCDGFALTPRGSIPIKGVGTLETWFLTGERPGATAKAKGQPA